MSLKSFFTSRIENHFGISKIRNLFLALLTCYLFSPSFVFANSPAGKGGKSCSVTFSLEEPGRTDKKDDLLIQGKIDFPALRNQELVRLLHLDREAYNAKAFMRVIRKQMELFRKNKISLLLASIGGPELSTLHITTRGKERNLLRKNIAFFVASEKALSDMESIFPYYRLTLALVYLESFIKSRIFHQQLFSEDSLKKDQTLISKETLEEVGKLLSDNTNVIERISEILKPLALESKENFKVAQENRSKLDEKLNELFDTENARSLNKGNVRAFASTERNNILAFAYELNYYIENLSYFPFQASMLSLFKESFLAFFEESVENFEGTGLEKIKKKQNFEVIDYLESKKSDSGDFFIKQRLSLDFLNKNKDFLWLESSVNRSQPLVDNETRVGNIFSYLIFSEFNLFVETLKRSHSAKFDTYTDDDPAHQRVYIKLEDLGNTMVNYNGVAQAQGGIFYKPFILAAENRLKNVKQEFNLVTDKFRHFVDIQVLDALAEGKVISLAERDEFLAKAKSDISKEIRAPAVPSMNYVLSMEEVNDASKNPELVQELLIQDRDDYFMTQYRAIAHDEKKKPQFNRFNEVQDVFYDLLDKGSSDQEATSGKSDGSNRIKIH